MRGYKIGSAFGIPIRVHITFLLILPLFAFLISTQVELWVNQFNQIWGLDIHTASLTGESMRLVLGLVAAVGLFACVVLHELGHSLVSIRFGYPIESITLWILGGIAQLSEQPEDWKHEFWIAIAGPAVSVALGIVSYAALVSLPASLDAARFVVGYLALANVALAVFNMLPGFPMDGGRVLRALLARTRPFARATQIAASVGKWFAILLGIAGLLIPNLFLVLIAFFIYIGASGESQQVVLKAAFEGVQVRDIMTARENLQTVEEGLSVQELIERMFRERHTGYPVLRNGALVGLVTLEDARSVQEVEREAFTVEDVMSTDLETIGPDASAMAALEKMQENGIGRLLVTDEEGLVGLISRTDLMTAFDIIQNSGAASLRSGTPEETAATEPEPRR